MKILNKNINLEKIIYILLILFYFFFSEEEEILSIELHGYYYLQ